MNEKLMGVFAPITTPFTADGTVDYSGLEHNVRAYAKSGLKGFLALGSNGENKSLTNEEKLKVLEIICTCKREDQVVMAGCIFESTFETIEMAHRMEAYHPDFLTLLPPNYFKKQGSRRKSVQNPAIFSGQPSRSFQLPQADRY